MTKDRNPDMVANMALVDDILEQMAARPKKIKDMTAQEFRDYKREKRQCERQEITDKNVKRMDMISSGILSCGCEAKAKWKPIIGWHCPACKRKV